MIFNTSERTQTWHRLFNTFMTIVVLGLGLSYINDKVRPLYEDVSGLKERKLISSEIAQIAADESYRACPYKDSLGLWTVGFGHLMSPEEPRECIDPKKAVSQLRSDYTYSLKSVENRYPWAKGEKKLVLVNLSYNLGENRLAKFEKTLMYLEQDNFDMAAVELLDSAYARQVHGRAGRLAARIMALKGD